MRRISALILTKFRRAAERAADWLISRRYQALFLNLPEELSNYVREYVAGKMSLEDVWRSYSYLTGLQQPFVNAFRYTMEPILNALAGLKYRLPDVAIYCYQDLNSLIEYSKLSEKLLLLSTGDRVRYEVRLREWKTLLVDELEFTVAGLRRIVENISDEGWKYSQNVVLYNGSIRPFKDFMEAKGFRVEAIYLQTFWRSPLDVLRYTLLVKGIDNVTDEEIIKYVRRHLNYLDYVLSYENIDVAHEKWVLETMPNAPCRRLEF